MGQDQIKALKAGAAANLQFEDYTKLMEDLLSFSQALCKQTNNVGERLCKEVTRATQGRVRLSLPMRAPSNGRHTPFPVSVSFPVRFCNRFYGSLEATPDPKHPASPALPLPVVQLLAHICGLLLYNLELSAFIEGQSQRLDFQNPEHLTKRERQVLDLICRGYDEQAIAKKLNIATATVNTYQKRIREKFGIHSERDISLAAYQSNLFSILG